MDVCIEYPYLAKLQNMAAKKLVEKEENDTGLFLISEINYSDKVKMNVLSLPENVEDVKNILTNVTSGTVAITGLQTTLEKI